MAHLGSEHSAHRFGRVAVALLAAAAGLAGCGNNSEAEPESDGGVPTSSEASTEKAQAPSKPILIGTRMVGFSGKVLPGSAIAGSPFCTDGTVRHEPGSPEIGFPAINVFDCPDGQLQIGFGPGPDQMNDSVQTSDWKILDGSGEFAGMSGEGQMKVRFPHPGASEGHETFRGTVVVVR